jgi:hypothetical protein
MHNTITNIYNNIWWRIFKIKTITYYDNKTKKTSNIYIKYILFLFFSYFSIFNFLLKYVNINNNNKLKNSDGLIHFTISTNKYEKNFITQKSLNHVTKICSINYAMQPDAPINFILRCHNETKKYEIDSIIFIGYDKKAKHSHNSVKNVLSLNGIHDINDDDEICTEFFSGKKCATQYKNVKNKHANILCT